MCLAMSKNERAVIDERIKLSTASQESFEIIAIFRQLPSTRNGLTHN